MIELLIVLCVVAYLLAGVGLVEFASLTNVCRSRSDAVLTAVAWPFVLLVRGLISVVTWCKS